MNHSKSKIMSLNGMWSYIKDPAGEYSFEHIKNKSVSGEFDAAMHIPQNWQLAGLNNYNGSVWFVREFDFSETDHELKVLKFNGVDYFADVWLNDIYLGSHKGYFQPFYFNVSSVIREKGNRLLIKVNSPLEDPLTVWPLKKKLIKGIFNHHDCRPGGWSPEHGQDQNTGGIWNNVELISSAKIYIDQVKITARPDREYTKAVVLAEVYYESEYEYDFRYSIAFTMVTPSAELIKKSFDVDIKCGKNKLVLSFVINNPELWGSWDTGDPNIYSLVLSGENNNPVEVSFGIKEVNFDDKNQFFINKQRLFLRGTNIIPTQFLSSLSNDKIHNMVTLMKEANINAVRIHAHVNRKEFLDECDRQGIIVWQDFSLQWTYDESAEFISDACEQIRDMVRLHYNHPSIAFWCCHNEPGEQINTLDPFLYDSVLAEDNTRIIRKASNYEEHPYDGWYWGKAEHFEAAPMGPVVTEFGAQGIPDKNSLIKFIPDGSIFPPSWELWKYHNFQYVQTFLIAGIQKGNAIEEFINNSQNYQSQLIRTAVDSYRRKKNSGITSIFQFMFIDCWPSITWSVVDYYGVKKKAYGYLKLSYQPVYLSVKMRQKNYFAGDKLNMDMWLINDTYRYYQSTKIILTLSGEFLWELEDIEIKEDSIKKYDWEKFNIVLPEDIKLGEYLLQFVIRDQISNKDISYNEAGIEIVDSNK